MKANIALAMITRLEGLKPLNGTKKNPKGWQLKTLLLLFTLLEHEGHNQGWYKDYFEWTYTAIGVHTKVLIDSGFVYLGEESDPSGKSRPLFLVNEARNYLEENLKIEI